MNIIEREIKEREDLIHESEVAKAQINDLQKVNEGLREQLDANAKLIDTLEGSLVQEDVLRDEIEELKTYLPMAKTSLPLCEDEEVIEEEPCDEVIADESAEDLREVDDTEVAEEPVEAVEVSTPVAEVPQEESHANVPPAGMAGLFRG